jgi:phage shock protein E
VICRSPATDSGFDLQFAPPGAFLSSGKARKISRVLSQTEHPKTMKWAPILIIVAIVVIVIFLKQAGQISPKDALSYLKDGALVIDVRSRGEFGSGHLPNAINIPLDEISSALPERVSDRDQVLLLHCQSGMRSAVAAKTLKRMGYTKVFNLGSLQRAGNLVGNGNSE